MHAHPIDPPIPAFVHVQRSGVSVTLPASAAEWAAWDARFARARDVTPSSEVRGR